MGRFIAIVICLVFAALVINEAMKKPGDSPVSGEDSTVELADPSAADSSSSDEAASVEPPAAESNAAESTPADVMESDEPDGLAVASTDSTPVAEVEAAPPEAESVLLGTGQLLGGIPGDGELTDAQIEAWLGDPKNHVVLQPELPLGLAAGVAEIKGIDQNPLTRAKIELGRQLYFDTRLSSDNTVSCATCHDPNFGYAKDTQFGVGVDGQEGGRNSPVAYNRILSGPQFWDGRAGSLEAQAVGPIANPIEMGNTHDKCVETLQGIAGYVKQFDAIFDDGVTIDNVGKAIATFERAIVTGPAPWDYYQKIATFKKSFGEDLDYIEQEISKDDPDLDDEDTELWNEYLALQKPLETHAISESAVRGGELFFSEKSGCTACHVGANFADEQYHNLGVGMVDVPEDQIDWGRFAETKDEKDRGAFKTPTVRNVSFTAPYMHDGSQKTLEEVVEWYAKGGHANPYLSEKVKKLDLTDQDKQDLVAFMAEGLKGDFPKVESGRLPQ